MMGADYYEHLKDLVKKDRVNIGVGKNCSIDMAILDKNCRVGDNVVIKGGINLPNTETDSYCIKDGIVVVKKGATIQNGERIGLVD